MADVAHIKLNDTVLDIKDPSARTSISSLETNWTDRYLMTGRKLFFYGDSYESGYTSGGYVTGYPELVAQYLGLSSSQWGSAGVGGLGLLHANESGYTFYTYLDQVPADDAVTDFILQGFTNDWAWGDAPGEAALKTALTNLIAKIRGKFPHAQVWVANVGWYLGVQDRYYQFSRLTRFIKEGCAENGAIYMEGARWALRNREDMASDNTHPIQSGQNKIARAMVQELRGNSAVTESGLTQVLHATSTPLDDLLTNLYFIRRNGEMCIYLANAWQISVNGDLTLSSENYYDLGLWTNCPYDNGSIRKILGRVKIYPQPFTGISRYLVIASGEGGHLFVRMEGTADGGGYDTLTNPTRFYIGANSWQSLPCSNLLY